MLPDNIIPARNVGFFLIILSEVFCFSFLKKTCLVNFGICSEELKITRKAIEDLKCDFEQRISKLKCDISYKTSVAMGATVQSPADLSEAVKSENSIISISAETEVNELLPNETSAAICTDGAGNVTEAANEVKTDSDDDWEFVAIQNMMSKFSLALVK